MALPKPVTIQITGDSVESIAPIFSNFLQISRVGFEVQFEFIFADINYLAKAIEVERQRNAASEPPEVIQAKGKTVAKVIVPAPLFGQLRKQFEAMFDAVEEIMKRELEASNAQPTNK